MTILQSITLGIVEGLTEFLPISSTFHLIWTSKLLHLPQTESQKVFEVVIQSGAILAVVVMYVRVLLQKEWRLIRNIIVSFIPTAVVGLVLYKFIKGFFFENYPLQLAVFVLVGILFIVFERASGNEKHEREVSRLNYGEAVMVGVAQALAVIPGVSRAGAVIIALMFLGIKRDEAAKYSFLLALPTILSASILDIYQSRHILLTGNDWLMIAIGFVAAFISALLVMKWFVKFLQSHTIALFGWYRIGLAIVLILFFWR